MLLRAALRTTSAHAAESGPEHRTSAHAAESGPAHRTSAHVEGCRMLTDLASRLSVSVQPAASSPLTASLSSSVASVVAGVTGASC